MVDPVDSILASIGNGIAPLFAPIGWGDWRAAVATLSGLVAKENVVATTGILYGFADMAESGAAAWPAFQKAFTPISGYSFLLFNLLCAPCLAAIGAIRREMGTAKWTLITIGYQTAFAYLISLIIYQFGRLFLDGDFGVGTLAALLGLAFLIYMAARPYNENGVKPKRRRHGAERI